jgi:hypothetical protein
MTTTVPCIAFTETDAARAYHEWRANCGPAALAACLGLTLDAVRPHLGDFEARGYMNPTMMANAVRSLGALRQMMRIDERETFPSRGLVRIQWGGPWINPGVPVGAAYARTHWVASLNHDGFPWVFDINGGWLLRRQWESDIVPLLIAEVRKADGSWFPTHRWDVTP